MKRLFILLGLFGLLSASQSDVLYAQEQKTLESRLVAILQSGLGQNYIVGYAQPLVNAFGITMSGGLFHRGYTKQFPHLDVGLTAAYIKMPAKTKVFTFAGEARPTFMATTQTGDTSGLSGCGLKEFYLPQLQLDLGLTSNIELLVRGSRYAIPQIGHINLVGAGIKFGLTDIIPKSLLALNVSVQAIYQTLRVKNWLNSATFGMNIQASKNVLNLPIDLYGGVGYEITETKFNTNKLKDIGSYGLGEISIDGDNNLRLTLGLGYTALIFNLHLDYNVGINNSFTGGVMFVF